MLGTQFAGPSIFNFFYCICDVHTIIYIKVIKISNKYVIKEVFMLNITENAASKIKEVIQEEGNPDLRLRVFVQGGGCSGFSYGFTLDEQQNEDDFSIDAHGIAVLVDSMIIQYLQGAEINYVDDISGSQFTIKNPNAETTCGCGSSFSMGSHYDYDEV